MGVLTPYREPRGVATFVSANKDVPFQGSNEEIAYWVLANKISDTFGGTPATVAEIYHQVARPMGLSSIEASEVVKKAKKLGYLRNV